MKDFKCFIQTNNGKIEFVSETKLFDEQVEIFVDFEVNLLSDLTKYKFVNGKFIEINNHQEEILILKRNISKSVSKYILEVIQHFDYDNLADLEICSKMKIYEKEANALKKWIESVYISYEKFLENINKSNFKTFKFDVELLPKYKG